MREKGHQSPYFDDNGEMVGLGIIAALQQAAVAGNLTGVAETLQGIVQTETELSWLATTANAVVTAPGTEQQRQSALVQLLRSEAATTALESLPDELVTAEPTTGPLLSFESSLQQLVSGLVTWPEQVLPVSVNSVTAAGGLGYLAIEAEQQFIEGFDEADGVAARERFVRFEDSFREFAGKYDLQDDVIKDVFVMQLGMTQSAATLVRALGEGQTPLHSHALLRSSLKLLFPDDMPSFTEGTYPSFVTDLMARQARYLEGRGWCAPTAILAAHCAVIAGIPVRALNHEGHVNLADPALGLAFDFYPERMIASSIEEWRESGRLGRNQETAPLGSVLSAVFLHASHTVSETDPERRLDLLRVAVAIDSSDPFLRIVLAKHLPPEEAEEHLSIALELHPLSLQATHALSDLLRRQGRRAEAIAHTEAFLVAAVGAIQVDSRDIAQLHFSVATHYLMVSDEAAARRHIEAGAARDPGLARHYREKIQSGLGTFGEEDLFALFQLAAGRSTPGGQATPS